jgi:hypothetical protein
LQIRDEARLACFGRDLSGLPRSASHQSHCIINQGIMYYPPMLRATAAAEIGPQESSIGRIWGFLKSRILRLLTHACPPSTEQTERNYNSDNRIGIISPKSTPCAIIRSD